MKKIIAFLLRHVPRRYLQRMSGIGLGTIGLLYTGNQVTCPICARSYRKFLPYGRITPRSNALCPSCLSLERHRLIWLYLQKKTSFFSTKLNVLHIAPEPCFIRHFEKCHGEKYITADLESPLAKVKTNILNMPFAENQFDVTLCNHVLEHVEDDIKAMREIHRVLKPGGWAILQIPFYPPIPKKTIENPLITDPAEREKLFGQDDHIRKYGKDYPDRIIQSGLKVELDTFGKSLTEPEIQRYGIHADEVIYIGKKPR